MNTSLFILVLIEDMNIIFAFIMCYLPMIGILRVPVRRIWQMGGILLFIFLPVSTLIVVWTGVTPNVTLFPIMPVFFFIYLRTVDTSWYKALTVYLIVISLFCFCSIYTHIFAARMRFGTTYTDHTLASALFCLLFSAALFGVLYRPASIRLRWLIENYHIASVWKGGIVWSILFTGITTFIIPKNYSVLYGDRFFYIYLLIVTLLLFCMLYMYNLLYLGARQTYNINKLERQNQFLGFQSKQYNMLTQHVQETRRIRHDFRQQMVVIRGLAEKGDLDGLKKYLVDYQSSLPAPHVSLCANFAIDAIASYYNDLCQEFCIPVKWAINLPRELSIPEPEFCMMLGNLLENAIDAAKILPPAERKMQVISHMISPAMLVLIVENSHNNPVCKKGHRFLSTKHSGDAIGLASVRETVECYHGDMRIDYDEHRFTVNILLNI